MIIPMKTEKPLGNRIRSNKHHGFTLVELLLVLVILGILAAIVIPKFSVRTEQAKEQAVLQEIRQAHHAVQPVLVGTASVEESERLSRALSDVPHSVLNARNEEAEADIVARAGARGAEPQLGST